MLTAIYYVNRAWRDGDGGLLRLHLDANLTVDVAPHADRLVVFRSEIEHEVLPYAGGRGRQRCALTQWYQDLEPPLSRSG